MKRIIFKQKNAQRIYDDYLKRVEKTISVLSPTDKEDVLMEINSHFYEGLQQNTENDEVTALLNITEKLGVPDEVFRPLVAEKKLNQAVKTFNPKHFFQAFILNANRAGVFIVISLCCLFSIALGITVFTKLFFPEQTGMFMEHGRLTSLGFTNVIKGTEVLGNWYIPLALLVIILAYFLTVITLRFLKKKKN